MIKMIIKPLKGDYYIIDNKTMELDSNLYNIVTRTYGIDVPENIIKQMININKLAQLKKYGLQIKFFIKNGKINGNVFDRNGNTLNKEEIKYYIRQHKHKNTSSDNSVLSNNHREQTVYNANNRPNIYDINRPKKIKFFESIKKLKNKFKLQRKQVFGALLITIGLALGIPNIHNLITLKETNETYNKLYDDNNTYVENHTEDKTEYDECPYTFEDGVVAFISDKGDLLDQTYQVAQSDDNNYYLNHDVKGKETKYGTIFKDFRNSVSLSDDFTIFYGHNLASDGMFGRINDYADESSKDGLNSNGQALYDYEKQHHGKNANTIIYTDAYGQYKLVLCSVVKYEGTDIINLAGNFDTEANYMSALAQIQNDSVIHCDEQLDSNSPTVCFVTCTDDSAPNKRIYAFYKAQKIKTYKKIPSHHSSNYNI